MIDYDKLYKNNSGRKSFQWQLWTLCNNNCDFCFLGEENKVGIKERQLISLQGLNDTIDNMDFEEYNNISLIGGEFFQGQLKNEEVNKKFFEVIEKIFGLYKAKKIGSIWITATLTSSNQDDLWKLLELGERYHIRPQKEYPASGLWICTSWDAAGRFHSKKIEDIWKQNMKYIKAGYPWVKLNTTIILQDAFLDMYLEGKFKPRIFMEEFDTQLFYMQPCLQEITDMMVKVEKGIDIFGNLTFEDFWLNSKKEFNQKHLFFPTRKKFIRFLNKYLHDDEDTFDKLFNIKYRSDEIHININKEDKDRAIKRDKDGGAEEAFPPPMKCGHLYNYAAYSDDNRCCICDKIALTEV